MFGIDTGELIVIALVALVVIGPRDLPRVMSTVGRWVGQARAMARQFRLSFDEMIRETEIEDMERKWREQNERIMRMHPPAGPVAPHGDSPHGDSPGSDSPGSDWGKPAAAGPAEAPDAAAPDPAGAPRPKPAPRAPASRAGVRRAAPPVPRRAAPPVPERHR